MEDLEEAEIDELFGEKKSKAEKQLATIRAQLKGFRATSLPFRESDKPITECDYDKFARRVQRAFGCEDVRALLAVFSTMNIGWGKPL